MPAKKITAIIYALSLIFIPLVSAEEVIDGKEIIRRMDLLMRGDMSSGIYEMTIKDPNWERTLRLKAWENRKEKKTLAIKKGEEGNLFDLTRNILDNPDLFWRHSLYRIYLTYSREDITLTIGRQRIAWGQAL